MRIPNRTSTRGPGKILRKPRRLGTGAVIGIAAPASPFDRETFDRGVRVLHEMGFATVIPEEIMAADRYLAGPDAQRAVLLQRLFEDDRIEAVICARGGYGCLRVLPLLDYERIAAHPKIFVGFSDVTALLSAITQRCGFAVLHGPVVTSLADGVESTRESLLAAISTDTTAMLRPAGAVTVRPGRARGVVAGGNLTTLCHLIGTPFQPSFRGRIVFMEDRGEAPYRIDRMLTQLKLAGCLEGVRGLALGNFTDCGSYEEVLGVFGERFADADIPILAGLPVGHAEPNLTLPFGIRAVLDADGQTLSFDCATEG